MKPISHNSEWGKAAIDFLQTLFHENHNVIATVMNMDSNGNVDAILDFLENVIDHVSNIKTNLEKEYGNN